MTNTPGHIELERSIDSIRIGSRHRVDLGDIDALASSIERHGLLQPITVTPDGVLVCGVRRLAALRQLGVRKLNVWVRSGISDRLTQLLAEQDDNALHVPLSPTESASLYREVKTLVAEDARRRQEATRFGATRDAAERSGDATVASPLTATSGSARKQAALIVSGRRSYTTLERIGDLQRIAADESMDEELRRNASVELQSIDEGASVAAAHRRINAQLAFANIDQVFTEKPQPEPVPVPVPEEAIRLGRGESNELSTELEQLAHDALVRAKSSASGGTAARENQAPSRPTKLPVRSFVFLWNDLQEWWLRYDAVEISSDLTESQWEAFESTLAGTLDFAGRLRALRAPESSVALQFTASTPER